MSSLVGRVILIVDDETIIREILIEEFELAGAKAIGATNGAEAFELLKQQVFDAVVSDVTMPGGSGLALFSLINEHFTEVPKLFLCTGLVGDSFWAEASRLGVVEVFAKPFDINHVIQAVRVSLAGNGDRGGKSDG